MSNYQVSWIIDVDANSHEEAASNVWNEFSLMDADLGTATVLTVTDEDSDTVQLEMEDYEETGTMREV